MIHPTDQRPIPMASGRQLGGALRNRMPPVRRRSPPGPGPYEAADAQRRWIRSMSYHFETQAETQSRW